MFALDLSLLDQMHSAAKKNDTKSVVITIVCACFER